MTEKDLHFKAVGESRWRSYTCDSPENKTAWEESLTSRDTRGGRRVGS